MQMIHAIATEPPAHIKAALESTEMRLQASKLRAAGIEITRPMSLRELDLALAGSPLSTSERIALKSSMARCKLLV
jgi:hypothetical protein